MMNNIKRFRLEKQMTVRDLSNKSGVAVGYISDLENDTVGTKNPSKDVMLRIAEALERTVPDVFFPQKEAI